MIACALVKTYRQELLAISLLVAFLVAFFNSHGVFSILGDLK